MDLTIPKEVVAAAVPAIPGYVAPQGPEEIVPADIPADLIDADFNYRRRKEKPADWAAFKEDVKARGQMQRVLLRPKPDGRFQLVFGNRRFRALVENEGPNVLVRADVRNLADEDATGMMAAENGQRANPSVIEDAELASRMLGLTKGDRDEAARRLGWNRGLFDRRVALMYACDKVRDAYLEDHLDVGHVEILAALRKEVQEKVITMLLEHEKKTGKRCTVPELKGMAAKSLLSLEAAIFDRTDCASCRYNTGNQQALFDESFEGTNCTNKPCYDGKTEATLEARKEKLAETYQVVRIVRAGDNSTVIQLRADGKRPVGAEQAQACRTCGDFGACVSALPDALGKTYQDVCFNKTCNDTKVEAYRQQLEQADKASQQQGGAEEVDAGADSGADDSQQGGDSDPADEQTTTTKPTRAATASASSVRSAIKDYREAIWRAVFEAAVKKLPMVKNRMLLLAILLHHPSHLNEWGAAAAVKKALGMDLGGRTSTKANLSAVLALTAGLLRSHGRGADRPGTPARAGVHQRGLPRGRSAMRMHDPASWEGLCGAAALAKLVADGKAVELAVTAKWMDAKAFAIDAQAFDRFVVWDGEATRRHLVHLDEADRLVTLIEASATAAFGMGGCFVCRAVDARGYRAQPERHLLTITNYGSRTEPLWLVHP